MFKCFCCNRGINAISEYVLKTLLTYTYCLGQTLLLINLIDSFIEMKVPTIRHGIGINKWEGETVGTFLIY